MGLEDRIRIAQIRAGEQAVIDDLRARGLADDSRLFTREQFAKTGDEAGVFMEDFSRALLTWAAMQPQTMSVLAAANVFNTTPAVVREAAEECPWIYVDGPDDDPSKQRLELDGE